MDQLQGVQAAGSGNRQLAAGADGVQAAQVLATARYPAAWAEQRALSAFWPSGASPHRGAFIIFISKPEEKAIFSVQFSVQFLIFCVLQYGHIM